MVTITGLDGLKARFGDMAGQRLVREVGTALYAAADEYRVDAQISITTGAVSGKNHVPSKPGEPPKNNTALLANNIETVQVSPLEVHVSSKAPYASALEYGSSKMAARPYMGPALLRTKAARKDIMVAAGKRIAGTARSFAEARSVNRQEQDFFGGVKGDE